MFDVKCTYRCTYVCGHEHSSYKLEIIDTSFQSLVDTDVCKSSARFIGRIRPTLQSQARSWIQPWRTLRLGTPILDSIAYMKSDTDIVTNLGEPWTRTYEIVKSRKLLCVQITYEYWSAPWNSFMMKLLHPNCFQFCKVIKNYKTVNE